MPENTRESSLLPERLKEAREKAGWTQEYLANLIDPPTTKATISNYEQTGVDKDGNRKGKTPSLEMAIKLAKALNISLDMLCGIEPDQKEPISGEKWLRAIIAGEYLFGGEPGYILKTVKGNEDGHGEAVYDRVILEIISQETYNFFEEYLRFVPVWSNSQLPDDTAEVVIDHMVGKYGKLIDKYDGARNIDREGENTKLHKREEE